MNIKQKQLAFELFIKSILNNVDFSKNENGEYQKDSTIAWFNVWLNGYEFGDCNETN